MMDTLLDRIHGPGHLSQLINDSKDLKNTCDIDPAAILEHVKCFVPQTGEQTPLAYCPQGLLNLIIECITLKPDHIDDTVKDSLRVYLKQRNVKVKNLLNREILTSLHTRSTSRTMTWLKFEGLLKQLIRDNIYLPRDMADEVLRTVKHELDPALGASLASALGSCVPVCREVNKKQTQCDEDEEKWCEIIDWMSWFLSNTEGDDLDGF